MHTSSYYNMSEFVNKYLKAKNFLKVLDIGSQEVPGQENSYRTLFLQENCEYVGADMVSGKNVDIVLENPYDWKAIPSKNFDCVICGQVLEHDEFFWLTFMEIKRVLKVGGLCCIIAPSSGPEHRYPVDCYRFYPDGMRAISKYTGLEVLECYAQWNRDIYPNRDREWRDCVLIARRPEETWFHNIKFFIKSFGLKLLSINAVHSLDNIDMKDYNYSTTYQDPALYSHNNYFSTLYTDLGRGFNEQEILRNNWNTEDQIFYQHYLLENGICRSVRFDPVESKRCVIVDLHIVTNQGLIEHYEANANNIEGKNLYFFDTTDPQIAFGLEDGTEWVDISCRILIIED